MHRYAIDFIRDWLKNKSRKPLIIRGARQVGKTWLARTLAKNENKELIELNFEKNPNLASLFTSNDPQKTLIQLENYTGHKIDVQNSLLFLDEIQSAPQLLAKLRWFAEELPELAIVTTGSLLEFALEAHEFSMPVGRIQYMYLSPLSFEEFLLAQGKDQLVEYLRSYKFNESIPDFTHQTLLDLFKEYILVGGLPAAVLAWIETQSPTAVNEVHHNLLSTYREDFAKYAGRINTSILEETMLSISRQLGNKFTYSQVDQTVQTNTIKKSLTLLAKARLLSQVNASHANGLPLGAEQHQKAFKVVFIDVGLVSSTLGLQLNQLEQLNDLNLVNHGAISEQVVGQLLKTIEPFYIDSNLFYWSREKRGSAAEIDYIIQHHSEIIPIEVKSGTSGSLKSLHLFMALKKLNLALRINADTPSLTQVKHALHDGNPVNYQLASLPFYLAGQIHRLLSSLTSN